MIIIISLFTLYSNRTSNHTSHTLTTLVVYVRNIESTRIKEYEIERHIFCILYIYTNIKYI